jgi:hypothetical protein
MTTTETIHSQAIATLECDIPEGMTIRDYRSSRCRRPSRWEKARVGILGAGVIGLIAETVLTQRTTR